MSRRFKTWLVAGAVIAFGVAVIAAGCGLSSRGPETPGPQDAEGGALASGGAGSGGRGGSPPDAGTGGFLVGGSGGSGGALDPGDSAQWNCDGAFDRCQGTAVGPFSQNGAGLHLTRDCVVESNRPRSQAECDSGEELVCDLAVAGNDAQLLVNCECRRTRDAGCGTCTSRTTGDEVPLICSPEVKICPCAYLGNR